jgi:hypothetical protein
MTWVREPDLRALVKKYIGEDEASYIPFGFEPISSWARLEPSDWDMIEKLRRELELRIEAEKVDPTPRGRKRPARLRA